MKSRIKFFPGTSFQEVDKESAALFSILMDEEFRQYRKNRKKQVRITSLTVLFLLIGSIPFIFLNLIPVSGAIILIALIFGIFQIQKIGRLKANRFIGHMGKFYWPISLYPFREGSLAIDQSAFTPVSEFTYSLIPPPDIETIKTLKETSPELFGKHDLFLNTGEKAKLADGLLVFGSEKKIHANLKKVIELLQAKDEKKTEIPILPPSHPFITELFKLLRSCEPLGNHPSGDSMPIIEVDASETFEQFKDLDELISKDLEYQLEDILTTWLTEINNYKAKFPSFLENESLSENRKAFLEACLKTGSAHFCPRCNPPIPEDYSDMKSLIKDENTRMRLTDKGDWECPVCGYLSEKPSGISTIYDEIIYPVTQLLLLHETDKPAGEEIKKLHVRKFDLMGERLDDRLENEKSGYHDLFSRIADRISDYTTEQRKKALFNLVETLEAVTSDLLEDRKNQSEKVRNFRLDLSLPDPLELFIPFYCLRYKGRTGSDEYKIIFPSRLAQIQSPEGAVNYELAQGEVFTVQSEMVLNRMMSYLAEGKYRLEKVTPTGRLHQALEKIKDADFYTEHRESFLEFLKKSLSLEEEHE